MISGYLSLSVSFILIMLIMLIIFLKAKTHLFIKLLLIPIGIWYSLVLFYAVPNIMGWPTHQRIPDNSQVIGIKINEPSSKDKGGIYFWLEVPTEEKSIFIKVFNPKILTEEFIKEPRAFKIPYSREMHKKIIEMLKNKKPGSKMIFGKANGKKGKKKKGDGESWRDDRQRLKVITPLDAFPKD